MGRLNSNRGVLSNRILNKRKGERLNQQDLEQFEQLPRAESCRLIDFDQFELVRLHVFVRPGDPPPFELHVSGKKPFPGLEIALAPRVHLQQPQFWSIEVVGRPGEDESEGDTYDVSLNLFKVNLANFNLAISEEEFEGVEGIRLIGATHSESRAFLE
jgi:hypothetical protein